MKLKSINTVLVQIPQTYEDTIQYGQLKLYIDTRFSDVRHTVRYGQVTSSHDIRFRPGDTVWFHHNIVRRVRDADGNHLKDSGNIPGDIYCVPSETIYAIQRDGAFKAVAPYCFIKPIPEQEEQAAGISIISLKTEKPQWGTVQYGNKQLTGQGVSEGDTIIFNADSEYEYPIEGEKLYRMQTDWIVAKIEL